jgi:hypothetical protein
LTITPLAIFYDPGNYTSSLGGHNYAPLANGPDQDRTLEHQLDLS